MSKHPSEYRKKKEDEPDNKPKFRVSNIEVRCARCIAPFVFVRAAVTVSVLKDANKDEAEDFAVEQCHTVLNRMELRESGHLSIPSKYVEDSGTDNDNVPDLKEAPF